MASACLSSTLAIQVWYRRLADGDAPANTRGTQGELSFGSGNPVHAMRGLARRQRLPTCRGHGPTDPWYSNYGVIVTSIGVILLGLVYMTAARPYDRGHAPAGDAHHLRTARGPPISD